MSQRTTLKIASAQYPIGQPKTLAEWEEKIARWVRNGAATGAELLVFPEYAAIEQAARAARELGGPVPTGAR
jgi:predicted amidohydrolase